MAWSIERVLCCDERIAALLARAGNRGLPRKGAGGTIKPSKHAAVTLEAAIADYVAHLEKQAAACTN
jgi:hypothetical protein